MLIYSHMWLYKYFCPYVYLVYLYLATIHFAWVFTLTPFISFLSYSAIIDTRSSRFNTYKRFLSCNCLRRLRTNRQSDWSNIQLHTPVFFINTALHQLLKNAFRGTCGYFIFLFPQPSSWAHIKTFTDTSPSLSKPRGSISNWLKFNPSVPFYSFILLLML